MIKISIYSANLKPTPKLNEKSTRSKKKKKILQHHAFVHSPGHVRPFADQPPDPSATMMANCTHRERGKSEKRRIPIATKNCQTKFPLALQSPLRPTAPFVVLKLPPSHGSVVE